MTGRLRRPCNIIFFALFYFLLGQHSSIALFFFCNLEIVAKARVYCFIWSLMYTVVAEISRDLAQQTTELTKHGDCTGVISIFVDQDMVRPEPLSNVITPTGALSAPDGKGQALGHSRAIYIKNLTITLISSSVLNEVLRFALRASRRRSDL